MIPKPKRGKSVSKAKKELWTVFSQYIRLRDCLKTTGDPDWGHCVTCSKFIRRTEGDAGHFISRGRTPTLFDETNVHLQCKRCNKYGGGEPLKYRRQIVQMYGEGYDLQLEEKAMPTKEFTVQELEELKVTWQQKIRELEKEVDMHWRGS